MATPTETFTADERRALEPHFTNVDRPVFALVNLPEVVKGALFARYSRSAKSVRRLFLDEFLGDVHTPTVAQLRVGVDRAAKLYERVFNEYGDDSVAQLGGAHIACEGVSNVLTKVLERGRLMAYLEQSTRYVPYTDRPQGRWKYYIPAELKATRLCARYAQVLDAAFETYAQWLDPLQEHFRERYPRPPGDTDAVYRAAIRAKTLDVLRGLLPAATQSNVGIYGSGQAFEALLLHLGAHPLEEARRCADAMLVELRKVIPEFLTRVDREDRGLRWSRYLADTRSATRRLAAELLGPVEIEARPELVLTDFDPDGEVKVVAAALYESSQLPDDQLLAIARRMTTTERIAVLHTYVGDRTNRRHRPGRAFERTAYRFDVLSDYGAFRDLQRHRLLTIGWQELSPAHGYATPEVIEEVGATHDWTRVMDRTAELYERIRKVKGSTIAQYSVPMAYRIRFYMHMNAREAIHVIELRTAPQGHPAYRRVCQHMLELIEQQAGHRAVADAMKFADRSDVELERLQAERRADQRRPVHQFELFSRNPKDLEIDPGG